jgi:hypothetical protein
VCKVTEVMERTGANCLQMYELEGIQRRELDARRIRFAAPRRGGCCALPTQNLVTSVKLNSPIFIAGTTISNASSPEARTGTLIASTLESI